MRTLARFVGVFIAYLIALGGTVEAIVLLWRWQGHQYFHSVNPTVAAAMVAAGATVTVSLLTLVLGRIFERQKTIESDLRKVKLPVQSKFVDGIFALFRAKDEESRKAAADALFNNLTPEFVALASDEVLIAWSRYKRQLTELNVEQQILELERILMAIRRDQGHKGRAIREGDLLGLFITDTEKLFVNRKPRRIRLRPLKLQRPSQNNPETATPTPTPETPSN